MENSTKILTSLLFLLVIGCRSSSPDPAPKRQIEKPREQVSQAHIEEKRLIRDHLYIDTSGNIHLKVKNCGILHPSQIGKPRKDSIFLSNVYMISENKLVALKNVLDTNSFYHVDNFGTYYGDSNYIYTYSVRPLPNQFFAHSRKGAMFLGCNKAYLLYEGVLYYQGYKVDGVENNCHLDVINFTAEDSQTCYDFIADKHSLYYAGVPLTTERFGFIDGLSDKVKKEILEKYRLKIKESD